jgi:hypothetical protein
MHRPIENLRDPDLEARAAALYSNTLPYHNFDHIQETLAAATIIAERCQTEHIRLDTKVVYYALLFHDAGYQDDHKSLGFATKEAYSAKLADDVLTEFAVPSAVIRKTIAAILATERDGNFISAEQKAVRAADLSGMAADYPEFLTKSLRLKREFEIINGKAIHWRGWQENSSEVLGFYLAQDIRLTSYFHNESGESEFHTALRENIRRLLAEVSEPQLD